MNEKMPGRKCLKLPEESAMYEPNCAKCESVDVYSHAVDVYNHAVNM